MAFGMFLCIFLAIIVSDFINVGSLMIKKECPRDEVHKSCAFHEEYSCWEDEKRIERVKSPPKRLIHCRSGCYCKKNWVRAYQGGICIPSHSCKDHGLLEVLQKLPMGFNIY